MDMLSDWRLYAFISDLRGSGLLATPRLSFKANRVLKHGIITHNETVTHVLTG